MLLAVTYSGQTDNMDKFLTFGIINSFILLSLTRNFCNSAIKDGEVSYSYIYISFLSLSLSHPAPSRYTRNTWNLMMMVYHLLFSYPVQCRHKLFFVFLNPLHCMLYFANKEVQFQCGFCFRGF